MQPWSEPHHGAINYSLCKHKLNLEEESLIQNYICTLLAQAQLQIARITVSDKAIANVSFYASLHQRGKQVLLHILCHTFCQFGHVLVVMQYQNDQK